MRFEDIDILEILPQRRPFVFVDNLLYCDTDNAMTTFRVTEQCIMCRDGKLDVAGLIENMAQSCASLTGYVSKYILKLPLKIGYLGSVRNMKIYRLPSIGEVIETRVEKQEEIFGIMLSHIEQRCAGVLIAEAQMKTAQAEKEAGI